ncbi:transporter substrate-binding domain-containing protein [Paucibacter soli]|uniref:transporter substrate-binding domain-containing protein n=1 Tax=Paucibacter soli TaxID=3133433 RepID=UPI0030AEF0CA
MKSKPLASLLRLMALLTLCVGLATPAAAQGEEASATLRKVRDTGVIVLGYRVASAPFSYLDAKLKPIGYSIDLCQRVVEAVRKRLELPDLEVKLIAVSSATRMPLVANGSVDLECGITTNTIERQKTQAFSITTFVAESRLLSKRASEIRGLEDLRGKAVATTIATTSIQFLHQLNQSRRLEMKILGGMDDKDAFRLLQTDRAVAYAMDDVLLRSALAGVANPGDYVISDEALSVEPYALGLPRDDAGFKQLVDGVLADLYKRGEIHAIYQRWFQAPIPPRGINLQLAMNEAFKRVIAKPTDTADPAHYR